MTPDQLGMLAFYVGSFAARHDAYVRDSRRHVNDPLSIDLVHEALAGGSFSVSGYLALDGHTHVGAIDFDMDDGLDRAFEVSDWLVANGVSPLVVGSRRGAHLWITTDWGPVARIRRALLTPINLLGLDPSKAEVFPLDSHAEWGCHSLRMPLMKHPKTGVRYPAYDAERTPITGLRDLLMAFIQTPYDAVKSVAGPDPLVGSLPPAYMALPLRRTSSGDAPRVTDLLASIGVTAIPGRSVRCPFHDDRMASLSVADDDLRVWCKSPVCPVYSEVGLGSFMLEGLIRKGPATWSAGSIAPPSGTGSPSPSRVTPPS